MLALRAAIRRSTRNTLLSGLCQDDGIRLDNGLRWDNRATAYVNGALRRQGLKQFFFTHAFTDAEVQSPDFLLKVVAGSRILKPLLDFFNYILFEEEPTERL